MTARFGAALLLVLAAACEERPVPAEAMPVGPVPPAASSAAPVTTASPCLLVLDVSGSMRAGVGPVEPGRATRLTRLDVAKDGARRWITGRPRGPVGLVVFATSAVVVAPPTELPGDVAKLLEGERVDRVVDPGGTAFGDAIATGVARLRDRAGKKTLVLITDGEHTLQQEAPGPRKVPGAAEAIRAAKMAREADVRVHVIQVGDVDEGDVLEGRDIFGLPVYIPLKTPRDRALLRELAATTGGSYAVVKGAAELETALLAATR
jgi:hypothetical protein